MCSTQQDTQQAQQPVMIGIVAGFMCMFPVLNDPNGPLARTLSLIPFVAPFVSQVDKISTGIPQAIAHAKRDSTIQRLDQRFHLAAHAKQQLGSLPNLVFGAANTVLAGAVAISTVIFLTLFLLYELPTIGDLILTQVPPSRRPRMRAAAQHLNRNIGGYVAGNLLISLICGAVSKS